VAVAAAGIAAVASPGPDFLLVAREAARYGRRAGLAAALGIVTGLFAHVGLGVSGLSLLVMASPTAFNFLSLAGTCYLLFVGFQALRHAGEGFDSAVTDSNKDAESTQPARSPAAAYRKGIAINVLNVKAMAFFLALFTQVIGPDVAWSAKAVLGGTVIVEAGLWFALTALVLSTPRLQSGYRAWARRLDQAAGLIFLSLGAGFALSWAGLINL